MRRNLSYYCLLAQRVYSFVLRAHPVRGESHNQRNATGEVATIGFHNFGSGKQVSRIATGNCSLILWNRTEVTHSEDLVH